MQGIGTDQVLGLLGDLAFRIGGQQFGADGSIQNVSQHGFRGGEGGHIGHSLDDPADQGLGNGAVDTVHAHMVTIVGAPAQGQFGQVTGTNHNAVDHGSVVHQDLGALTGLGIFKGAVVDIDIVTDVLKMKGNSILDADLLGIDAQGAHQLPGIVIGAVRGAEAGHGHTVHVGDGTAQLAHGLHSHQQCQGGIQTTGNADDRIALNCGKPLLQAGNLDLEDLQAALHPLLLRIGHECQLPQRIVAAVGTEEIAVDIGIQVAFAGNAVEGAGLAAVGTDAAQVAVHHDHMVSGQRMGIFVENTAVFRNDAVAGEHQVGGGFGMTGGGEGIDALAGFGDHLHQFPAVGPLAHQIMGGSQIQDHFRAVHSQICVAGLGHHAVLTDLDANNGIIAQPEQLLGGYGNGPVILGGDQAHILGSQIHGTQLIGGGKPALFIGGQMGLGHDTADLAPADDGGAVVELMSDADGQTHHSGHIGMLPGNKSDLLQTVLHGIPQGILEEQVAAGIAGEGHFGEQNHVCLIPVRFLHHGADILGILLHIAHLHSRHGTDNTDKVQHR